MPNPTFELISWTEEIATHGVIRWAVVEVTGTVELVFPVKVDGAGTHLGDVVTANLSPGLLREIFNEMRRSWWWLS
jgi:hypothetical protein